MFAEPAEAASIPGSKPGLPRPDASKVLVVDDVDANLVAMRALLAEPELEVLSAASGPQALEMLLQHDVALAILDVQMPGMDGYALAELMRGSARTRGVPIIFLTAGAQEARSFFRGYEAGAVDFLYKPLDERVLRSKVAVFVELHRQRRTIAEHAAHLDRLMHVNAQMLAALSHDLRAPLTALALNAELLLKRSESPALAQAAARQKAAAAVLSRQIDHLLALARLPATDLRMQQPMHFDLAEVVRERWAAHAGERAPDATHALQVAGDTAGQWDRALLTTAVDQLLLQAHTYASGAGIRVELDGSGSAVVLRVSFPDALPDPAASHLFGGGGGDGFPTSVGHGLRHVERIARAHGGSLVGRSQVGADKAPGTQVEMMLPRSQR